MDEQLKSLSKIFTETLLRIPDFQRGYAWSLKEVNDYWNDILRLGKDKKHYVGVLTLDGVKQETLEKWLDDTWLLKSKNYQSYYVVDGQQRLTTSMLLIKAIIDIMNEKNIKFLNYMSREGIMNKYIYESKPEENSKSFLFSYELQNPSYDFLVEYIYQNKEILETRIQETAYTKNLKEAYNFFFKKLNEIEDNTEIEIIFKKITQDFLFNVYKISSEIDVYVAFETMNNRGKPLSNLERLKNRLIYLVELLEEKSYIKERLRREVNDCWKEIYHSLGKKTKHPILDDEFLFAHYFIYFKEGKDDYFSYDRDETTGKTAKLLDEVFTPEAVLSKNITSKELFKYLESLKITVVRWTSLLYPEDRYYSKEIKNYINLIVFIQKSTLRLGSIYDNSKYLLILAIFSMYDNYNNNNDFIKFLETVERNMFVINILTPFRIYLYQLYDIDESVIIINYIDLIIKLRKKEIYLEKIIEIIENQTKQIINSEKYRKLIIEYYEKNGFYDISFLRYFFYNYECELREKNGDARLYLDYNIESSVEHIFPQKVKNQYWKEKFSKYNLKTRKQIANSLGNFIVISSRNKNSKLSNKGFEEKKGVAGSKVGYKYSDLYSEKKLTDYNQWTIKEIKNRGIELCEFMERRWKIKIGNKNEKLKFLGLFEIEKESN